MYCFIDALEWERQYLGPINCAKITLWPKTKILSV